MKRREIREENLNNKNYCYFYCFIKSHSKKQNKQNQETASGLPVYRALVFGEAVLFIKNIVN